jgi:hypothetical protein
MAFPGAREVEVGIAISHGDDCGEWYVCEGSISTDTSAAALEAAARYAASHLQKQLMTNHLPTSFPESPLTPG